ncbi:hypothetical protein EDD75_0435 [Thermodesulfitimonas autotrophica]|uniref:Uncharacterized protein n=1 Tax=Thermodesulfitimonas autotrophica TaxID=1894989 RepID=A0A3N5AWK5_9THEO|nr:hypothetical protein [Thermodesulfitimonas autotrophica]RPF49616.1 hypothetical protein EDD75_0435 [Thermodesulfitimonas autotrophica]
MEKVLQQILEELKSLRAGQEALQKGQEAQGRRLERLEKGQETLRAEIAELRLGQEDLQNQITRLEVRLETEAFEKIGALFDGFQLHREILERIEKKIEAHDARLDLQENEITFLRSRKK